jgi:predicted 3-demethylubiquinone-9 3-methyltransferase (glyoxalase superfamily)
MTNSPIAPCLWFEDQAEAAAALYLSAFPDAHRGGIAYYPASGPNPSGRPPGSVMTVDFSLAGQRFTALNGGPAFELNPSISFFVFLPSAADVEALHGVLHEGGQAAMPLGPYPWSERYAWIVDRFGVSWQLMTDPGVERATIAPCLMFTDTPRARAHDAIEQYVGAFPGSSVALIDAYPVGEAPEGFVRHGRFNRSGQPMAAMDSNIEHGFAFNEGVSLQILCRDQDEIDHYWRALSAGGQEGRCGWLTDRFGVSWQVVPEAVDEWMRDPDPGARERAFQAMLGMGKLDIEGLRRAAAGS